MRPIPSVAHRQCGVFSSSQAFAAGWTKSGLSYAVRTGRVQRLRKGAYQVADTETPSRFERLRWLHAGPAIAGVLTTPGALASHSTSAVLRGIPLIFIPELACVSVVPWHTGDISGVHVHRCASAPHSLPVGEVSCTSLERTGIDLAREHGLASGVVAIDYLLHERLTTYSRMYEALDRCVRWPGIRAAREAVALSDPLSESPLESRSRLKFRDVGLPAPELQVRIGNEGGRFVARTDFFWKEFGVVGEADGDIKYDGTEPEPLIKEKRRQGLLEDLDLEVVRWGNSDLRNFAPVAERLRRAFRRGARQPSGDRVWTVLPRL